MSRRWTPEDYSYLQENWGTISINSIAENLGRSKPAVLIKASKLGLGPFLDSGDYITVNQLSKAFKGGTNFYTYQLKSWVENRGFPMKTKRVGDSTWRIIYLDDFWEWAERNRSFLDFSKMEPLALGMEPAWVAEQRKKDFQSFSIQRKDRWTPSDDDRLRFLLRKQCYTWPEIAHELQRSEGAIQRRCTDLGIKDRPVKADNCGKPAEWMPEHYALLADGVRNGDSYLLLSRKIGKSEKAIRGKVYSTYFTENLDKVRPMLSSGEWGNGAGTPTVRQAAKLSGYRADTRDLLERLGAGLRKRVKDLRADDPLYQKDVCAFYDDLHGCTKGGADCDVCIDFQRVKPQYCARCGCTFFERIPNRFCPPCRAERKKRAQRHWRRAHNKNIVFIKESKNV